jgi:oxaloacetate decarboxylase beta subunit
MEAILNFVNDTGFVLFFQAGGWKNALMLVIACFLLYLGIGKKFEPLLMVPIAFGMLMTNLPGANMFHEIFFAGGHIHWDLIGGAPITQEFLTEMAALGVSSDVLPAVCSSAADSLRTGIPAVAFGCSDAVLLLSRTRMGAAVAATV